MTIKMPTKLKWPNIYKISLIEVFVLFTILFFTYTMPLTVNKFSRSFFGKLLILLSIGLVSYYRIIYGIILAVLFIGISEIGYMESFSDKDKTDKDKNDKDKNKNDKDKNKTDKDKNDKDKNKNDKKAGKEGMENKVQASKTAFINDHCGANRVNFDLQSIQDDYTQLVFINDVCDPCDPACGFNIDDTTDSLYNYDRLVNPVDRRQ